MEIIKYALAHGLAAWVGVAEGSEQPPATPANSVATALTPPPPEEEIQPSISSRILYYKGRDGKLLQISVPIYYRDERGEMIPLETLFEESDLDSTTSEEEDYEVIEMETEK